MDRAKPTQPRAPAVTSRKGYKRFTTEELGGEAVNEDCFADSKP